MANMIVRKLYAMKRLPTAPKGSPRKPVLVYCYPTAESAAKAFYKLSTLIPSDLHEWYDIVNTEVSMEPPVKIRKGLYVRIAELPKNPNKHRTVYIMASPSVYNSANFVSEMSRIYGTVEP